MSHDRKRHRNGDGLATTFTRREGRGKDGEHHIINNPQKFFKKGRFFMAFWAEPRGFSQPSTIGHAEPYFETCRFIVIRSKRGHCLCLGVHTYGRQGTSKLGVGADHHAAVIADGDIEAVLHPKEKELSKRPIHIVLETRDVTIDSTSRLDFSRVYTIEYNIPVRNIGRILPLDLAIFETYFSQTINIPYGELSLPNDVEPVLRSVNDHSGSSNFLSGSDHGRYDGTTSDHGLEPWRWLQDEPCYKAWESHRGPFLWIMGEMDSQIASIFEDLLLSAHRGVKSSTTCYINLWKDDTARTSSRVILNDLILKLLAQQPELARYLRLNDTEKENESLNPSLTLWENFLSIARHASGSIICLLDGFDHYQSSTERFDFTDALSNLHENFKDAKNHNLDLRFAVTSRPDTVIERRFPECVYKVPSQRQVSKRLASGSPVMLFTQEMAPRATAKSLSVFKLKVSRLNPSYTVLKFSDKPDRDKHSAHQRDTSKGHLLCWLNCLKHPNIFRCVTASAYFNGLYNLPLPGVQYDLEWCLHQQPNEQPEKFRAKYQIFAQLWRLSSAIEAIHMHSECVYGSRKIGFHGNLKPRNVLFFDDRFLICDFGLSKLRQKRDEYLHQNEQNLDFYRAPEIENVVLDFVEQSFGRAIDVWSFGLIILEILFCTSHGHDAWKQCVSQLRKYPLNAEEKDEMFDNIFLGSRSPLRTLAFRMANQDPKERPRFAEVTKELYQLRIRHCSNLIKECLGFIRNGDVEISIESRRFDVWIESIGLRSERDLIEPGSWLATPHKYDELHEVEEILTQCCNDLQAIRDSLDIHRKAISPLNFKSRLELRFLFDKLWATRPKHIRDHMTARLTSRLIDEGYFIGYIPSMCTSDNAYNETIEVFPDDYL